MDEEKASKVAEKSGHRVNAGGTRFAHDYLSNRGGRMAGQAFLGRRHGSFKGAAAGKCNINKEKFRRAFRNANARIGVSRDDDDIGVHAQIFKKGGVHYGGVNAVGAVFRDAYMRHADALAHALMVAEGG
jgi:hypothetical protein